MRLTTAGLMREWGPRLEELNLEATEQGVGVSGGVDHLAIHARILHEAGRWVIQTDASNAFSSVLQKPKLEQVAACTSVLTTIVAKCERRASLFFQMDSGERTKLKCSGGVQLGSALGPALLCLLLRPVLTRVREEYESQGGRSLCITRHHYRGRQDITQKGRSGALPRARVDNEGHRDLNPDKTVALATKGHVPTPADTSPSAGVGVRIADEGGIKVVRVPVGTDEFAIETAIGVVRDGGAEQLARMLPRKRDKQAANLKATGPMVQRTAYVGRVMDPKLSLPAYGREDVGAVWILENVFEVHRTAEVSSFFEEGCMAERLTLLPHQCWQASLSTGTGGCRMSSAEARWMSVSVRSLVATPPAVLVDLSGSLGEKVRRNLPGLELVTSI